ncbi:MAG TPA: acetyl-CoA C-acyltransferase [Cytophagaceae bacterium]|jgi:acetyl-CoA C-acetyltransferase
MNRVFIISAVRTPIGSIGGSLASLSATQLGATAIKGAIAKGNIGIDTIDEVYMGNVLSANLGQSPARQASIFAGIGYDADCTTINKVCASGSKAIMLAAQSIMLGLSEVVVAGGMESMSNVPYYLDKARYGYKLGHGQIVDGVIKDGLWDVYNDYHMGNAAENTAKEMNITREMQDAHAIESYQKAAAAAKNGIYKEEIVEVEIVQKGKESIFVNEDEEYKKVNFEKISTLRPVFDKEGTITAANASTLNDGASALILVSEKMLDKFGLTPLAEIIGFADAAQRPEWFTTAPSLAIPKALENAKLTLEDVDYYEINEAFSVVSLAINQKLNLSPEKVNIYGGGVSLGHPIGCSGARIVTTLVNVLNQTKGSIGVSAICNGGGGASAIVLKNSR